jgi:hypothetical protein
MGNEVSIYLFPVRIDGLVPPATTPGKKLVCLTYHFVVHSRHGQSHHTCGQLGPWLPSIPPSVMVAARSSLRGPPHHSLGASTLLPKRYSAKEKEPKQPGAKKQEKIFPPHHSQHGHQHVLCRRCRHHFVLHLCPIDCCCMSAHYGLDCTTLQGTGLHYPPVMVVTSPPSLLAA